MIEDITKGMIGEDGDTQKSFLPELGWESVTISDSEWLYPEEEWEKANTALKIGDAPIAMIGGLTLYTGHPGNGKSMAMALTISAILNENGISPFVRGEGIANPTVLYVDTEMEKYNTQRLQSRVYAMNNWAYHSKHDEFRILRLRDTIDIEDVLKKIWKAVSIVKPTYLFIDGLLDCVKNFNDNEESSELIRTIGAAASYFKMCVIAVIHKNPGTDKSTGHAGSFGERKAVAVIDLNKDKTDPSNVFFTMTQKKARDKDASDVMFKVVDDENHVGIPEVIDKMPKKENYTIEQVEKFMRGIADKINWPASKTEIKKAIKDFYGISNNGLQTEITNKAENRGWIVSQTKDEWVSGQSTAKWKLNIEDLPF